MEAFLKIFKTLCIPLYVVAGLTLLLSLLGACICLSPFALFYFCYARSLKTVEKLKKKPVKKSGKKSGYWRLRDSIINSQETRDKNGARNGSKLSVK